MSSYFDDDDEEKSIVESSEEDDNEDDNEEEEEDDEMEGGDDVEDDNADNNNVDDDIEDDDNDEQDDEQDDDNDEMEGGGDDDEDDDNRKKKIKKIPAKTIYKKPEDYISDDDEDDDNDGEQYLQKFDQSINENYLLNFHPESVIHNYDEILSMTKITRNADGDIIDKLHRTIPFLTKYERARILGQRAKQINSGAYPFIKVPENIIDGYLIAELELKQKKIPFIIRRPLLNGGSEYWCVKDLEDISF